MEPILPSWFKQRQCKAEPAGEHTLRVTGPNLAETFLRIEPADGRWRAALRPGADAPDASYTDAIFGTPRAAWDAAFELYRDFAHPAPGCPRYCTVYSLQDGAPQASDTVWRLAYGRIPPPE